VLGPEWSGLKRDGGRDAGIQYPRAFTRNRKGELAGVGRWPRALRATVSGTPHQQQVPQLTPQLGRIASSLAQVCNQSFLFLSRGTAGSLRVSFSGIWKTRRNGSTRLDLFILQPVYRRGVAVMYTFLESISVRLRTAPYKVLT
jgi:hypothetical protein